MTSSPPPVTFGVDRLLTMPERWRRWRRVGLVTNNAARLATDAATHTRVALRDAGVPLVRLFGPEHGLSGTGDDGVAIRDDVDALTGLPVVSLYGARMRPTGAQLADLDVVLFDIPDVGARCYTYAWTLFHVLAACADARTPVVVLDRPNPLGGVPASDEGPLLDAACRSFLGEDAIPLRHGCTLGQLARLWQYERYPTLALDVIDVDGWDASCAWPHTLLPWVGTSPAMPAFESAVWYTGTCLGEAANLSVGRGTDMPFAVIGAPWLDAERVAYDLTTAVLPALRIEPVEFTPVRGPWVYAAERCRGVRLHVADVHTGDDADHIVHDRAQGASQSVSQTIARTIRPVRTGLAALNAIARLHPTEFAWASYVTAANPSGADHLARLLGRVDAASAICAADLPTLRALAAGWTAVPGWAERLESAGVRRPRWG